MARARRDPKAIERAAELAHRINILIDLTVAETGRPYTFGDVDKDLRTRGIKLSKPRWYYLKEGTHTVSDIPLLEALADIFQVPSGYLITLDSEVPPRVASHLAVVQAMRRANVKEFAARSLDRLQPKTLEAVVRLLESGLDDKDPSPKA